ncbi:hypothetical protein CWO90_44255 [Bradyrhizobium sp. Leo121]|nr:hypothetical protein CWO90_44255 [Bradyrhizobium sp. Leo121]
MIIALRAIDNEHPLAREAWHTPAMIKLDALAECIIARVHLGWNAGAGTRLGRLRTIAAAPEHITEAK